MNSDPDRQLLEQANMDQEAIEQIDHDPNNEGEPDTNERVEQDLEEELPNAHIRSDEPDQETDGTTVNRYLGYDSDGNVFVVEGYFDSGVGEIVGQVTDGGASSELILTGDGGVAPDNDLQEMEDDPNNEGEPDTNERVEQDLEEELPNAHIRSDEPDQETDGTTVHRYLGYDSDGNVFVVEGDSVLGVGEIVGQVTDNEASSELILTGDGGVAPDTDLQEMEDDPNNEGEPDINERVEQDLEEELPNAHIRSDEPDQETDGTTVHRYLGYDSDGNVFVVEGDSVLGVGEIVGQVTDNEASSELILTGDGGVAPDTDLQEMEDDPNNEGEPDINERVEQDLEEELPNAHIRSDEPDQETDGTTVHRYLGYDSDGNVFVVEGDSVLGVGEIVGQVTDNEASSELILTGDGGVAPDTDLQEMEDDPNNEGEPDINERVEQDLEEELPNAHIRSDEPDQETDGTTVNRYLGYDIDGNVVLAEGDFVVGIEEIVGQVTDNEASSELILTGDGGVAPDTDLQEMEDDGRVLAYIAVDDLDKLVGLAETEVSSEVIGEPHVNRTSAGVNGYDNQSDGMDEDEGEKEDYKDGGYPPEEVGESLETAEAEEPLGAAEVAVVSDERNRGLKLPMIRVRKMMKTDPDIELVSLDALFLITKSTELFVEVVADAAYHHALQAGRSSVLGRDLDACINLIDALAFLEGTLDADQ